ncbi:MAG: hypothetical protein JSU63_04590 [Phycisphaerales bacterium]|nr:MAG: hypothetical protein JSU63_04590 [Phycisphaerales bacterium]
MHPKTVSWFFIKLVLTYGLFIALWVGIGDWYASAFRSAGTSIFKDFGPSGIVVFQAKEEPTALWDSDILLGNHETKRALPKPFGTRYRGYAPTSVLLALVFASPLPWRRRLLAAAAGLVLLYLWIGFGLWLQIMAGYAGSDEIRMYELTPFVDKTLSYMSFVVATSTVSQYAMPVFFWILVTFRRDDWELILSSSKAGGGQDGAASPRSEPKRR